MAKISDLKLQNEQVGEALDYSTMPEQMGSFQPPPQPGPYRFRFPKDLSGVWEVFDHTNGKPPGQRISAQFDDAHPLTIIQSPGGVEDGNPFHTKISNAERKRGKKDDQDAPYISDWDYFFRDVWGILQKPKTNKGYADEIQKHAGSEFGADVSWSWKCNPKRNIFTDNGQGGSTEVEGTPGCGTAYYERDVKAAGLMVPANPEEPGGPKVYPLRVPCQCGATIRAFANLGVFRK